MSPALNRHSVPVRKRQPERKGVTASPLRFASHPKACLHGQTELALRAHVYSPAR
jgi:hypothetical protein